MDLARGSDGQQQLYRLAKHSSSRPVMQFDDVEFAAGSASAFIHHRVSWRLQPRRLVKRFITDSSRNAPRANDNDPDIRATREEVIRVNKRPQGARSHESHSCTDELPRLRTGTPPQTVTNVMNALDKHRCICNDMQHEIT